MHPHYVFTSNNDTISSKTVNPTMLCHIFTLAIFTALFVSIYALELIAADYMLCMHLRPTHDHFVDYVSIKRSSVPFYAFLIARSQSYQVHHQSSPLQPLIRLFRSDIRHLLGVMSWTMFCWNILLLLLVLIG